MANCWRGLAVVRRAFDVPRPCTPAGRTRHHAHVTAHPAVRAHAAVAKHTCTVRRNRATDCGEMGQGRCPEQSRRGKPCCSCSPSAATAQPDAACQQPARAPGMQCSASRGGLGWVQPPSRPPAPPMASGLRPAAAASIRLVCTLEGGVLGCRPQEHFITLPPSDCTEQGRGRGGWTGAKQCERGGERQASRYSGAAG